MVGAAVCRELMQHSPRRLIVSSLAQSEAEEAVGQLRKEFPSHDEKMFIPWSGNIFTRTEWKDLPREVILSDAGSRRGLVSDIIDELSDETLKSSALYSLLQEYRPDLVVDCINTATAIAYQDVYASSRSILNEISDDCLKAESAERLLASQYIPQLSRHIQLLYRGLLDAKTTMYVKVGTSGTGGMGLNIPYTHSEEQPSRVLLAKSAVAGAQTLLLFLMARSPGPIVKEVKPSAAIAWKKISYGEIRRKGRPIPVVDMQLRNARRLEGKFSIDEKNNVEHRDTFLSSVFIDTGENGIFSRAEFETISSIGQMELITPEEIAQYVVFEILGGNTGYDIMQALDGAVMGPSYRGGGMRNVALEQLRALERRHGVESIAFEMLGPPRLAKLLYEAHILKLIAGNIHNVIATSTEELARRAERLLEENAGLRQQMLSVGLCVLLPTGEHYLRGEQVIIPPDRGNREFEVTQKVIEQWCHDGWIDLRTKNFSSWQKRLYDIRASVAPDDTSSREVYSAQYWDLFETINEGKLAAWIFEFEEKGSRFKR